MGLIEDIQAKMVEANTRLTSIGGSVSTLDVKLDEIQVRIQALIDAGGATVEQLQSILADASAISDLAASIGTHAEAVVIEADSMDGNP